ncbi:MAG TPA: Rrf2 family transcriptional regulator [Sedimentisphaerales bacterium]|jgi:Rrf2 family protein|nr:Rrf2 family transcriptional regulator [Sedimentisphaerales bacterium]HNU28003.1 Rrf2 family transcriptional regulator [Sedimentisphaerales bacterium]
MKLSTRTRYGMRAIIELAQHEDKRPLQLKTIAERQDISVKYLEQLMSLLRSAGFVRSVRGSKGGYTLGRPADQITLSEIFRCLEGAVTTAECVDEESYCARSADCAARDVWIRVEKAIQDVLGSIRLSDLIRKSRNGRAEYQI